MTDESKREEWTKKQQEAIDDLLERVAKVTEMFLRSHKELFEDD